MAEPPMSESTSAFGGIADMVGLAAGSAGRDWPGTDKAPSFPIINCSSSVSTIWTNLSNCGAILRYARAFPPGIERNQHRQVAVSLRKLFRGQNWLRTHTLEGAMLSTDRSGRNQT
jgi:hypothetical protein